MISNKEYFQKCCLCVVLPHQGCKWLYKKFSENVGVQGPHLGPGGVKGQRPCGGSRGAKPPREKLNFHTITAEKLASPGQKLVKIRRLERINNEEILPNIITYFFAE